MNQYNMILIIDVDDVNNIRMNNRQYKIRTFFSSVSEIIKILIYNYKNGVQIDQNNQKFLDKCYALSNKHNQFWSLLLHFFYNMNISRFNCVQFGSKNSQRIVESPFAIWKLLSCV